MTATALAASGRQFSRDEIRTEIAGVLCRCTGYEFIVNAVDRYLNGGAENDADGGAAG
jgi:aerobic-type carbon monoxide dehydrogenase small subunit (CoxS/CutS family)